MPTESRFAPTNGTTALIPTELAALERTSASFHPDFVDESKPIAHSRQPGVCAAVGTGEYATDGPVTYHGQGSTVPRVTTAAGIVETRPILRYVA